MNIELEKYSLDELKALSKQVDQAIASYEDRRRREARREVEKVVADYGFSMADVVDPKATAKRKQKSRPKFRNPDVPEQTWSGRGRRPGWFSAALQSGKTEDEMRI